MFLNDLVTRWQEIEDKRKLLEKASAELKRQAEELMAAIGNTLDASNMKSVRLDGLGTVYKQIDRKTRLTDLNKFCAQQIKSFAACAKDGRPWVDGLLFQQRVRQTDLLKIADTLESVSEFENIYGIAVINEAAIRMRKD
jgi:hypothetical protein